VLRIWIFKIQERGLYGLKMFKIIYKEIKRKGKEMRKMKLVSLVGLAVVLVAAMIIMPACKETEPEIIVETVIETVTETVTETVEVKSPLTFEALRDMAEADAYEGEPAKGITLAFHNLGDVDFTVAVEESIVSEWALAGGNPDDLTLYDAAFDTAKAAQNHDIIIGSNPDAWIQFWYDANQNNLVGLRAREEGIPIIAVDIPVLGSTFMGANNFLAGKMIGDFIVDYIENVWGGWDEVDIVTTPYDPFSGDVVLLRVLTPLDVLAEKYGESAAYSTDSAQLDGSKVVLMDTQGGATAEKMGESISNILAANPDAEKVISISINAQGAQGVNAGADTLGRWDPDNWLLVTNGGEAQGFELMRDGILDGDVAYFPESYGKYLIPAVIAMFNGNPVPPEILVDHVMLTPDNLDDYYPES